MRWSVLFCVVLFLLGGCHGTVGEMLSLSGSYQVTCTGESLTVTGTLEVSADESRFTITSPETLSGAVYTLANDIVTLTKEGITCAVPDTAWSAVLLRVIEGAQGQPIDGEYITDSGTLTLDNNGNPVTLQTADFYAEFVSITS